MAELKIFKRIKKDFVVSVGETGRLIDEGFKNPDQVSSTSPKISKVFASLDEFREGEARVRPD